MTETSGSSINYGSGKETSDNTQERRAKKTVDAAIQTSADVTVLKDQKESAKTVSQTSALKVPSHKYPTRTKLAGRSSGNYNPPSCPPYRHLVPVRTGRSERYPYSDQAWAPEAPVPLVPTPGPAMRRQTTDALPAQNL